MFVLLMAGGHYCRALLRSDDADDHNGAGAFGTAGVFPYPLTLTPHTFDASAQPDNY
jgi:hypothetical protein